VSRSEARQTGALESVARQAREIQESPARLPGTPLAIQQSMVGARSVDACARIEGTVDSRLGKYRPLVVAVMAALILALVSIPKVTLPLR